MDLKLTEEEKLIRATAAQFVSRELMTREGDYLRQKELFLPPGDPARRELDSATREALGRRARQIGLWALELPESAGGSVTSTVARVLIFREFGRTVLPFEPACAPALFGDSAYAKSLAQGKLRLSLAFDEAHKTGALNNIHTCFREETDEFLLSDGSIVGRTNTR